MPGFGPISFKNSDGKLVHLYTGNAKEIHVDPNNPDVSGDGSSGNPLLTLDAAVALAVAAGGKNIIKLSPDVHTIGSNINIIAPLELVICGGESAGVVPPFGGIDDIVTRLDFNSNQIIADATGGAVSIELVNLTLISAPADPVSSINGGHIALKNCRASSVPVVIGAGSSGDLSNSSISSVQNAGNCGGSNCIVTNYTGTSGSDASFAQGITNTISVTDCTFKMQALSEALTVFCSRSDLDLVLSGIGTLTFTNGGGDSDANVKADVISDIVLTGGTTATRINVSCARLGNASFAAAGPEVTLHVTEEITGSIVTAGKLKIFERPILRIGSDITPFVTADVYFEGRVSSGATIDVSSGATIRLDIKEDPGAIVIEGGGKVIGRVIKTIAGAEVIVDRNAPGGHFVVNLTFNNGAVPLAPPVRDALGQLNFVYGPGSSEELVANALLEYNRVLSDPSRVAAMTLNLLLQAPAPGPLAIGVSATEIVAGVPIQTTGVIPYAPVIGVAFVPQIVPITVSMPGGFTPGSRISIVVVNLAGPTFDFIDAENVPLFQ